MTKKPMKSKIRLPILLLIIAVPLATLLLFNIGFRIYVDSNAKKELQAVSKTMETVVRKELAGNFLNDPSTKLNGTFVKLYRALSASKLSANTGMLLYSRRQELLYPKDNTDTFITQAMIDEVSLQLPSMKEKKVYTIYVQGVKYYSLSYKLTNLAEGRPTIVFISRTGDVNTMLGVMNLILIIIMIIGAVSTSLVTNHVASKVADSVTRLTGLTRKIGEGDFSFSGYPQDDNDILEIEQLYQSIGVMAERLDISDKTQKTFLQNASHELRTPLMSIQGYAEGIENEIIPDVKHAANIISSESKRLNLLVDELLTLSRIENRTYDKELCLVNLPDALKEYAQRLGGYASKLDKQLRLSLPESSVPIMADDALLSQAVMNIASNCLRYAHSCATIALIAESESTAIIHISDDGGGIPESELPHIFERFYKGKGGNFGLGLAIAKSAVEFMGGRIKAYNENTGAVFTISFPLRK